MSIPILRSPWDDAPGDQSSVYATTGASTARMPTLDEMLELTRRLDAERKGADERFRKSLQGSKCHICHKPIGLTDRGNLRMCGHLFAELRRRFPPDPQLPHEGQLGAFDVDRLLGFQIELYKDHP